MRLKRRIFMNSVEIEKLKKLRTLGNNINPLVDGGNFKGWLDLVGDTLPEVDGVRFVIDVTRPFNQNRSPERAKVNALNILTEVLNREEMRAMIEGDPAPTINISPANLEADHEIAKIFVSHSSEDREIAANLVNLLKKALNLAAKDIRCTSVPGHGHTGGAITDDAVREDIPRAKVVLGLLTRSSLKSQYVFFELGAAWGQRIDIIPVLIGQVDWKDIDRPLKQFNGFTLSRDSGIHSLVESIGNKIGKTLENASSFSDDVLCLAKKSREYVGSQD